jgi:Raf kinase inhibitor-like YbhB/YbcL family protein
MRRVKLLAATAVALILSSAGISLAQQNARPAGVPPGGPPGAGQRGGGAAPRLPLSLMSPAFPDGASLPVKYTCSAGQDAVSPPLHWMNAPNSRAMVSFALIMHDNEPRPGKGVDDFLHWMVWNIPAVATGFPEGVSATTADLPDGSLQTNGNPGQGGIVGYRPPCPPMNVALPHHYIFDLYALDTLADLPAPATRSDLMKAMNGHVVAHASIVVTFNR